jgi:peptidoglycan-associated lipoprotein
MSALALAVALASIPMAAHAQQRGLTAPSQLGMRAPSPSPVPGWETSTASPEPARPTDQRDERHARSDLDYALTLIDRGDQPGGQRELEQLIARFPQTVAADEARALLAPFYMQAAVAVGNQAGRRVKPDATGDAAHRRAAAVDQDSVPPPPVPASPRVQVKPESPQSLPGQAALQESLRLAAGDRVFFADASVDLGARARGVLEQQALWLARRPDLAITIEGHADDNVLPADLARLAGERADAVRRRLIDLGVAPERILIAGHGAQQRIALCPESACRAQNRRAITVITHRLGGERAVVEGGDRLAGERALRH